MRPSASTNGRTIRTVNAAAVRLIGLLLRGRSIRLTASGFADQPLQLGGLRLDDVGVENLVRDLPVLDGAPSHPRLACVARLLQDAARAVIEGKRQREHAGQPV